MFHRLIKLNFVQNNNNTHYQSNTQVLITPIPQQYNYQQYNTDFVNLLFALKQMN